jgi:hypothetical protein
MWKLDLQVKCVYIETYKITYIYIYIYRERERERENKIVFVSMSRGLWEMREIKC